MVRRIGAVGGLVLVLAATASAQPPGGGGRGGFGRMFGLPTSATSLAAMDEVQAELKTTDEQNTKIDALAAELREEMQGAFGSFQDLQNLSDEERAKRMAEGRTKAEEAGNKVDAQLANVLKPEQNARLGELRLQRDGINSIARNEVAELLGLTQEQKDKIAKVVEAGRQQSGNRNFRDLSDEERQKAFAEMRERREKTEADLTAVLTDEQKKKFEELQGEKFEFPQPRFGGRGSN